MYVTIVPRNPSKELFERLNAEKGAIGASQLFRNSSFNSSTSPELILSPSKEYLSNRYEHFFITFVRRYPDFVSIYTRNIANHVTESPATDSK